jgi:zinc protease
VREGKVPALASGTWTPPRLSSPDDPEGMLMTLKKLLFSASVAALTVAPAVALAASAQTSRAAAQKLVPTQQFTLSNGLKVIMHVDRSDPVVAVALNAHVGSARRSPAAPASRTCSSIFLPRIRKSGKGGLDKLSARIGGSGANGSTSRDLTDYLQTVPKDALEKMIWAEADKLGFFINTVTEPVLAKEKQVVKNEKGSPTTTSLTAIRWACSAKISIRPTIPIAGR